MLRKLYDWVMHWAETKYAVPALFALAFAESSFFPVPPDVLLIALAVSKPARALAYSLVCTIGSVLGGLVGYAIGRFAYDTIGVAIVNAYHGQAVMDKINGWYQQYGFWGVFVAGVTPIPYKVFTIASGVFHFALVTFVAASVCGRAFRFFLVGGLIRQFGAPVRDFIERYFNVLSIVFVILLVGGFLLIKLVAHH